MKNVWIPASPSLVLLGPHVMLFHREAISACVLLAGKGNCAKTVSELIVIFIATTFQSELSDVLISWLCAWLYFCASMFDLFAFPGLSLPQYGNVT